MDSADTDRIDVVKQELERLLEMDEMKDVTILVLANKQDLAGALNPSQVTDRLELRKVVDHQWFVQATCAKSGEGLVEGLEWLAEKVKEKKRKKKGMFS